MILRNTKVVIHSEDTMAEREEFDVDSQKDMMQDSDRQMYDNSQIREREMGVDGANKEVLSMMHAMFNHLEEKLAENQNELRKSQEKMSSNLEEKLAESQNKLIECQENLKISMNNSLKDSVEKIEESMECLEERTNGKIIEQKVEFNVIIQEVEDRMIQRTMEETCTLYAFQ